MATAFTEMKKNKNLPCTSCGTTDRKCYENRNDKFNGACCWSCHRNATHGQNEPGYLPIYQAIKERSMQPITNKSTKVEVLTAYKAAQRKLDNILPLIREYDESHGLNLCEEGIQDFCDAADITYIAPVKEMNVNLSVTFVDSLQTDQYGDSLSEEAIKEITTKIDGILEAAGVSANVNYKDSWT